MVNLAENELPRITPSELIDSEFLPPAEAVSRWERGETEIAPPVLLLLRLLAALPADEFLREAARIGKGLGQGELHPAWFAPGTLVAPLRTPTLPPATTTNTVIFGHQELYVIDPATPEPGEQARLFRAMDDFISGGRKFQ